jgi:GDP/UDP-N,N'-diacetylbacillosamine 2-epimerase (hydrolysing)
MVRKKIAVVTGTRAEYGLLRPVIRGLSRHEEIELQIFVTAAHLSPEFGMTVSEIEEDEFPITERIEVLLSSDSASGVGKSMGLAMIGFSEAFSRHRPDLLILLGDRFETFCVAAAATVHRLPIAHIHGGELTIGAMDDAFRHSITKMSQLHFASTEVYRRRIIQMGESPDRVFNVGSLGVEASSRLELWECERLEADLGIDLRRPFFIVTFHPTTLDTEAAENQITKVFAALDRYPSFLAIITKANADQSGRTINDCIETYARLHPDRVVFISSLGQERYLSLVALSEAVIGNSSSGIIEAPSLRVPTVNIGSRQMGRVRVESVIDCVVDTDRIVDAISHALDAEFRTRAFSEPNPYNGGATSEKIVRTILELLSSIIIEKRFVDIGGMNA